MLVLESKVIVPNLFGDGAEGVTETYADVDPDHPDVPPTRRSVVQRRKPLPVIVVEVCRGRFAADGVDYAEAVARIQDPYASEDAPEPVYLTVAGDVTFEVNLSSTTEAMDGTGQAAFRLSTTTPGTYTIRASMSGYGEASAQVEAVMV